jgi:tetratricopeptide (TPR) repeat protein
MVAALVAGALGLATPALAADLPRDAAPPRTAAARAAEPDVDTFYARAEAADLGGDFAEALAAYRAAIQRDPSNRHASQAERRADFLAAHSEGGFAPLQRLEAVRRDPHTLDRADEVAALARDAASFPDGPVRVEARVLAADAFARLGRSDEARALLRAVLTDRATDPLTARHAARALVRSLTDSGDFEGAIAATRVFPVDRDVVLAAEARVRRAHAHTASIVVLAASALLAAIAIGRAARRGHIAAVGRALRAAAPLTAVFAAYVAIAGGAIAVRYEGGDPTPFHAIGVVLLPVALLARAWGAAGSPLWPARALRAILAASSAVAASFLALEKVASMYLKDFGL